ncbi:MAG TPA: hypothetical protein VGR47_00565 [Terracidiphilus sp.]|nr:hypothetical protein [Terracidiphilus sp.]
MTYAIRGLGLAAALALVSTLALVPPSMAQTSPSAPVANVYVQISNGVNVYNTASNGRLTLVAGSPFKITGQMAGAMANHLVSLDDENIYVYSLASNGAVEGQVGETSIQDFSGSQCGTVSFSAFDRTGQDLYVGVSGAQNQNLGTQCIAIQSFKISSAGTPSYLGTTIPYNDSTNAMNVYYYQLVMSGGNQYAYAVVAGLSGTCDEPEILAFQRESSGALELAGTQSVQYPEPPSGGWQYFPYAISVDSNNHLAVNLSPEQNAPCGTNGSPQLGSFSINNNGSIASTNTYQNMPTAAPTSGAGVEMGPLAPSNAVLPAALGNNLQLFHFNGSSPITSMTGQIPVKGLMSVLQWDTSSHLYGLNISTKMLRVFTVTSNGLVEDPGSPMAINGAQSLFVVSPTATCSAPSGNGVNVCSPAEGATVTSPVSINAAATVNGGVYRFSLWNKNTKLLNEDNGVMEGSISLAPGTYKLIFDAVNSSGVHADATRDITVK